MSIKSIKEMSFDGFAHIVQKEIQNYFDGTNKQSNYAEYTFNDVIYLFWTNDKDLIGFRIGMSKDRKTISFGLDCGGADYHSYGETNLPNSEEEYFQMSTINEMGFSWGFYEFIINTFKKLRTYEM